MFNLIDAEKYIFSKNICYIQILNRYNIKIQTFYPNVILILPGMGNTNTIQKIHESVPIASTLHGTIISPARIKEGLMVLRNENQKRSNLLKSLVVFQ